MKNYLELIEKFHNGELSNEELEKFKIRLRSNPEFKREFDLYKEINDAVLEDDVIELRKRLNSIQRSSINDTQKNRIRKLHSNKWYLAAAAITIVIIIGTFLISIISDTYSNEELFKKFYEPEDAVLITRSGNSESDLDLTKALQQFEQQNYKEAIPLLKKIDNNVLSGFYLGIAYIETKNFSKAINEFKGVIEHGDNLFIEQSEWYLGLCYLMNNEKNKAIKDFRKIIKDNSLYKPEAEEILSKIK
jgi:tetratricopeptide (TPR) repeat protein